MVDRNAIKEGMRVETRDGEKLGKIERCASGEFTIEKGFFFPREYIARFEDVLDLRDGDTVVLAITRDELDRMEKGESGGGARRLEGEHVREHVDEASPPMAGFGESRTGYDAGEGRLASSRDEGRQGAWSDSGAARETSASTQQDMRIPVAREELDVEKHEREAGRVVVTKEIETEEKEIKVPVRREKVRVERQPATEMRAAGEDAFQEKSISVPVHAEEVEIRKRPVVSEEVRINREPIEEERTLRAGAREEKVDVRTEGDVDGDVHRGEPE